MRRLCCHHQAKSLNQRCVGKSRSIHSAVLLRFTTGFHWKDVNSAASLIERRSLQMARRAAPRTGGQATSATRRKGMDVHRRRF
jgi:hypothetical protein